MNYGDVANPKTYTDVVQLHQLLTHMRRHQPVAWIEASDHRPFWAIAKHVARMTFSSTRFGSKPGRAAPIPPSARPTISFGGIGRARSGRHAFHELDDAKPTRCVRPR